MKRALFIDRDGTLVVEPPVDYQLDSLEKVGIFYPKIFRNLYFIRKKLDFEFVMVSNQDGLGTASFPEETLRPAQNKLMKALKKASHSTICCLIRQCPKRTHPTGNLVPECYISTWMVQMT